MISKEIAYLGDFAEEADKIRANFGVTDLYSSGSKGLDKYLGGGYGRPGGYEIIVLYGPTGIGKSLVALNLLAAPIKQNKKIGLLVLEDDMTDVFLRLEPIVGAINNQALRNSTNLVCLPNSALDKSWTLPELLDYIEGWFTQLNCDIILLDHLQFAFEGSEAVKGENEYIAQRVFMQKLNQLMKRTKKTIILVSHVGKAKAKGMDRIVGSTSIAAAATKVIEIDRDEDDFHLTLRKSRFTKTPKADFGMELKGAKLVGTFDAIE